MGGGLYEPWVQGISIPSRDHGEEVGRAAAREADVALRGYKKNGKPAPWTLTRPPKGANGAPETGLQRVFTPKGGSKRRKPAVKAPWTVLRGPVEDPAKAEKRQYRVDAMLFIWNQRKAGLTCQVVESVPDLLNGRKYGHPVSAKLNEVHHMFGRRGRLLNWQPGWMPVSKQGHRWVHANIREARRLCFYAPLGFWEDWKRVQEVFGGCRNWVEVQLLAAQLGLNDPERKFSKEKC
jgi:hypothetical protein